MLTPQIVKLVLEAAIVYCEQRFPAGISPVFGIAHYGCIQVEHDALTSKSKQSKCLEILNKTVRKPSKHPYARKALTIHPDEYN